MDGPGGHLAVTLAAGGGSDSVAIAIGLALFLGVGAQWAAWRLKVPSILLLLLLGILAGPVARSIFPGSPFALDPDTVLGSDLLLSLVGVSVGIILFEGGLTLNFRQLGSSWRPVTFLVSTGALITWIIAGLAAKWIFGLSNSIAIQLGAVLIVTGPTVIGPLLAHIRPSGSTGLILKWEGIVIDPIGVMIAVLVFEAIVLGSESSAVSPIVNAILMTIMVGGLAGFIGAILLRELINRFWIPDYLQNPVSLMFVVAAFTISNQFQQESGLLATTVMGIVLANQRKIDVHHILEFKENLRVLLIALLFIILAARLKMEDLTALNIGAVLGFLGALIFIARPTAVFLATVGAGLSWRERIFLSWVAPRGIVAAAAASVFALGLEKAEVPGAERLVPLTFAVIIGTVAFYGLTASWGARLLGIADQNPQGVVFVGAPRWARLFAGVLHKRGIRVLMIDTNRANITAARMDNLPAEQSNILTVPDLTELDLRGIGRVFAITPNDEVNTLALQRFKGFFETVGLYRIVGRQSKKSDSGHTDSRFRTLFDTDADHARIESLIASGWIIKATSLSQEFTYRDFRSLYGPQMVPLATINSSGTVTIATTSKQPAPVAGDTIVAMVNPEELLMNPLGPEPEPEAQPDAEQDVGERGAPDPDDIA